MEYFSSENEEISEDEITGNNIVNPDSLKIDMD